MDESGDIALDLALSSHQESVAKLLLDHKASVNQTDNRGWTLLHKAIDRSKILWRWIKRFGTSFSYEPWQNKENGFNLRGKCFTNNSW